MTFTVSTRFNTGGKFSIIALSYQNTKYLLEERRAPLQERPRDLENQCQGAARLLAHTNTAINSTRTSIFFYLEIHPCSIRAAVTLYVCGMCVDTDEQSIHSNSSSQRKRAGLVSSEINRCDINTRAAEERTVLQAGLDSAVIWLMNHLC